MTRQLTRIAGSLSFVLGAGCTISCGGSTSSSDAAGWAGSGGTAGAGGVTDGGRIDADAAGAGGTTSVPDGAMPPRPPWQPGLPLGEPGWRDSSVPFCSNVVGGLTPEVWSSAAAVYANVIFDCNELAGYPCSEYGGKETLYENDGTGWTTVLEERLGGSASGSKLAGWGDGAVLRVGGQCTVETTTADGETVCEWNDGTLAVAHAAVGGDQLYMVAQHVDRSGPYLLLEHARGGAAVEVASVSEPWTLAASDDGALLAGRGSFLGIYARQSGQVEQRSDVPKGDYTAAWMYSTGRFVLGNGIGQIVSYGPTGWAVRDTGWGGYPIADMWGAADGTVYFVSDGRIGRWRDEVIFDIYSYDSLGPTHYFTSLWGNASDEVFLTVNDRDFREYQCGSTFLVWFDGALFHEF